MTTSDMDEVLDYLDDVVARVTRIESRIVQLMYHFGVEPHGVKEKDKPFIRRKNSRTIGSDTRR